MDGQVITLEDQFANSLPSDTGAGIQINANTYTGTDRLVAQVDPTTAPSDGVFDHASRLGDKLVGAVLVDLDQAISKATGAPNSMATQKASAPNPFIPQKLQSWFSRNTNAIATFMIAFIALALVSALARR